MAVSPIKRTVASRHSPSRSPSIVGSSSKMSWARSPTRMLRHVGLLNDDECQQIERVLSEIRAEIEAGDFVFVLEREDVHMHIEAALVEKLGDVGRKLHTVRSRNDQVATGVKLWTREALDGIDAGLIGLQRALVSAALRHRTVILPGYTHMQRAQPVLAAHYLLAYVEMLERDRSRLADCRRRLNVSPLGAAALAGTSLPIDRDSWPGNWASKGLRQQPGCRRATATSSSSSVFVLTMIAKHLSRLGRGVDPLEHPGIRLPGPGRRDLHRSQHHAAEEEPGRAGTDPRPCGAGVRRPDALLVLVKGLPLAYNRDLQEDKEPLFDAFDTVGACLELAAVVVEGACFGPNASPNGSTRASSTPRR